MILFIVAIMTFGGLITFPIVAVITLALSGSGNPYALEQGVKLMLISLVCFCLGLLGFQFI